MEPGSEVQVKDLKSRLDLNGKYGIVKEMLENGRIAVKINEEVVSLSSNNLTMIKIFVNTTVEVTSLKNRKDLNGKYGTVKEILDNGRYVVEIKQLDEHNELTVETPSLAEKNLITVSTILTHEERFNKKAIKKKKSDSASANNRDTKNDVLTMTVNKSHPKEDCGLKVEQRRNGRYYVRKIKSHTLFEDTPIVAGNEILELNGIDCDTFRSINEIKKVLNDEMKITITVVQC